MSEGHAVDVTDSEESPGPRFADDDDPASVAVEEDHPDPVDVAVDEKNPDPAWVTVDGDRAVAYAEYGAPAGRPVVFLHGTPGSRHLAALFDGPARRAGVRLLAPDRPGYGRSDPWPDRTLTDTADVVAAVLTDAGVDAAGVVGFSGGGPHALAVAAARPALVRRVDVVSGSPPPSLADETPAAVRLFGTLADATPRLLRGLARAQAWVADRAPPSVVVSQYTSGETDDPVRPAVARLVRRDFVAALAGDATGFVTESRLLGRDWDFRVADVASPTGLWHGARDANAPVAGARELADRLPDGDLTVLDDADHLGTLLQSGPAVLARRQD